MNRKTLLENINAAITGMKNGMVFIEVGGKPYTVGGTEGGSELRPVTWETFYMAKAIMMGYSLARMSKPNFNFNPAKSFFEVLDIYMMAVNRHIEKKLIGTKEDEENFNLLMDLKYALATYIIEADEESVFKLSTIISNYRGMKHEKDSGTRDDD